MRMSLSRRDSGGYRGRNMKRYERLAAKATKAAQASPDFWGWADLAYLAKEMIKITDDLLYNTKPLTVTRYK